jgi:hypothetical protein
MIIAIILVIMFLIGICIFRHNEEDWALVIEATGGVLLIIWLSIWVGMQCKSRNFIVEFKDVQKTVQTMRKNQPNSLENTAVQLKIIEYNKALASAKYWNSFILFDELYTDDIKDLESLE